MSGAALCETWEPATSSPPLFEMKFPLDREQAEDLERVLDDILPPAYVGADYGSPLRVASLYYDTADLAAYRGVRGYGRRKYRIRSYGDPHEVRVERKVRSRSRTRLRASIISVSDLLRLNADDGDDTWAGAWFRAKLREYGLRPCCLVGCDRKTYGSLDGSEPAWINIDRRLRCRRAFDHRFDPGFSGASILQTHAIMEVRFPTTLPAVIRRVIGDLRLEPRGFSKYRTAVETLGLSIGRRY